MVHWSKSKLGLIFSIAGILIAIVAVLWITVIFPSLDKIPADYHNTYYFDAEFEALNFETVKYETLPLRMERAQKAVDSDGDIMFVDEVLTVVRADTGEDMSARYGSVDNKTVNRSTNQYVADLDELGRSCYFAPPRPLHEGDSFDMWQPGAMQALKASYVGKEEFRGLDVMVFNTSESCIPVKKAGFDMFYKIDATFWIEPNTGAVVNQEFLGISSADEAGKVPILTAHVKYTEYTINDLMALARHGSWMLYIMNTVVPWALFSVAAALILIDVLFLSRRQRKARSWKVSVGTEVSPYPNPSI